MLKIVGLGLSWKDISLKGLEAIHDSQEIYLEDYTSVSDFSVSKLERLIGKKIKILNRKDVEEKQVFLNESKTKDVVLLVYGDPLSATTHYELLQDAKKHKIKAEVIHAPSVFSAVAETGLSLYRFGQVASIPFRKEGFEPKSFLNVLQSNLKANSHTLFLLDLDTVNKKFLTISEAIEHLLKISNGLIDSKTVFVGCASLGSPTQIIKVGSASELKKMNFGEPPYCIIVPAKLNFKESEYLNGLGKRKKQG